jgi:HlyD family secretion protein
MKRKTITAIGISAAIVVALGGGYAYSASSSRPLVGVATVSVAPLKVTVSASGELVPARTAGVYPPVSGTLASVSVRDGAAVTAGQVLARLNTGPLKLAVAQARAAYSAAVAELEAINNAVPTAIERSAARAALSAARSQVSTATKNYSDYRRAYDDAPADQRPAMVATLRTLRTAKASAQAALTSAKAGKTKLSKAGRVSAARTAANQSITATSSALSRAKNELRAAELTAPFAGTVTFADTVEAGSGVTAGVAVFTVVDPNRMEFEAAVNETDITTVDPKQSATVTVDAFNQPFTGRVIAVQAAPQTTSTGTVAFGVRISIDVGSARVFPGMSGSADIVVQSVADALSVPVESVLTQGSSTSVFVLGSDDVAHARPVTIGVSTDAAAQVLSGLSAGEQVVTTGAATLSDGQRVRTQ